MLYSAHTKVLLHICANLYIYPDVGLRMSFCDEMKSVKKPSGCFLTFKNVSNMGHHEIECLFGEHGEVSSISEGSRREQIIVQFTNEVDADVAFCHLRYNENLQDLRMPQSIVGKRLSLPKVPKSEKYEEEFKQSPNQKKVLLSPEGLSHALKEEKQFLNSEDTGSPNESKSKKNQYSQDKAQDRSKRCREISPNLRPSKKPNPDHYHHESPEVKSSTKAFHQGQKTRKRLGLLGDGPKNVRPYADTGERPRGLLEHNDKLLGFLGNGDRPQGLLSDSDRPRGLLGDRPPLLQFPRNSSPCHSSVPRPVHVRQERMNLELVIVNLPLNWTEDIVQGLLKSFLPISHCQSSSGTLGKRCWISTFAHIEELEAAWSYLHGLVVEGKKVLAAPINQLDRLAQQIATSSLVVDVLVSNFPEKIQETDLMELFHPFRPLNVVIMINMDISLPNSFPKIPTNAYVTLPDYMTAVEATRELDGTRFRGKAILVEVVEHGKHMGQPLSPSPALQPYPATFKLELELKVALVPALSPGIVSAGMHTIWERPTETPDGLRK
ncbi:unnamed protein product [Darwinula stevensoni]|uniref:RRM domain-containing protein n=1 Tax=Darwinula stevensoni TaxID=69355 RepID=A0A7R9A7W8_9CRUS|nr:unnamed protein product [Darwinula stevensoni]CAG0893844.1 unnamed protein product [Darwinula stevensoni]